MAQSIAIETEIKRLYNEEGLGVPKILIRIKQAFPGSSYDSKTVRTILAASKTTAVPDEAPYKPASSKPHAKGKKPAKPDPPLSRAKAEEGLHTLLMSRQKRTSVHSAVRSVLI